MTNPVQGKRAKAARNLLKRMVQNPMSRVLSAMLTRTDQSPKRRHRNKIHLETLEPRVLMSVDVNPAALTLSGAIDIPGEKDYYAFSVEETTRIVFDSQTSNAALNWRLEGPTGQITSAS
jgi:hypothetical protein